MRKLAIKELNMEKENEYFLKGLFHYKNKNYGKAICEFKKANFHSSYYMLAMSHLKLGNLDECLKFLWNYENDAPVWDKTKTKLRISQIRAYLKSL